MNVLHLCSDFAKQDIYDQLVTSLEVAGLQEQHVYAAVRSTAELSARRNDSLQRTTYHIAKVLRPYHRLFFRRKIATVFGNLLRSVTVEDTSLSHAHFLFSDGAVALRLFKDMGIPYVVAVRNTDINFFLKYRPDLRLICNEILHNARAIIFISPCYQGQLTDRISRSVSATIRQKFRVVPSGVPDLWSVLRKSMRLVSTRSAAAS